MIGARGRSFGRWLQRNTPTPIFLALQVAVNAVGLLGLARFTNPISEAITRIVIANEEAHVQSGANFMVMGEEQAGKEKNIKADGRHREQQANVKAKTKGVTQTGDHNNTTATLHETLKTEADKAKDAAEKTLDSTQKAGKAVAEFTHAEESVSKAYTALQEALNALEVVQVTHEVETDHMQAVHSAFLDIIVAEENLKAKLEVREIDHVSALKQSDAKNTANLKKSRRQQTYDLHQRDEKLQAKIEMSATQHKSDLAQEYDKNLAKRNHELEDLLANQSVETLDKISRMTTIELEKQQAKILALDEDDFNAIDQCQAHIKHLEDFIATTKGVMDDKLKAQVMDMKAEDNTEEEKVEEVLAESQEVIPPNNNTSVVSSVSIDKAKHNDILSVPPVTQQQKATANARLQELKANNTVVLEPDNKQIGVISHNKASVTEAKQTTAAQWGKSEPCQESSKLLEKEAHHGASIRVGTF